MQHSLKENFNHFEKKKLNRDKANFPHKLALKCESGVCILCLLSIENLTNPVNYKLHGRLLSDNLLVEKLMKVDTHKSTQLYGLS